MIKGRDGSTRGSSSFSSSSNYSADLLVCFPSRAHLALTPKPICSPSRLSDSTIRRPQHRRQTSRLSGGGGGGHGSPALWAKQASNKNMGSDEIAEPTSPKVTCAGQIKVRPSKCGGKGKNWQSVMEEIERIHVNKSQSKFFGLKKDVLGFLTCLRNVRFDFRCFGDFRHADVTSDDDDEEDEEEEEEEEEEEDSKTVFSKWFMVLQEEKSHKNDDNEKSNKKCVDEEKQEDVETAVPPPNALLLMRCRSAPAKSWLEERMKVKTEEEEEEQEQEQEEEEDQERSMEKKKKKDLRSLMEEEKMELVLMRYDTEFYRLSSDIAKETWVVGGIHQDPLSRSRSWKS